MHELGHSHESAMSGATDKFQETELFVLERAFE